MERKYSDDLKEVRFRLEQMWSSIGDIREILQASQIDLKNDSRFDDGLNRLSDVIREVREMTFPDAENSG